MGQYGFQPGRFAYAWRPYLKPSSAHVAASYPGTTMSDSTGLDPAAASAASPAGGGGDDSTEAANLQREIRRLKRELIVRSAGRTPLRGALERADDEGTPKSVKTRTPLGKTPIVGGGHDALLRHYGAHRRRRCNTGTGFRSTCGRFPSATRSWCVQQRRARPSMFTMGCCITLVTTPVPYGVPRLAMRPFYNVATRRGCGGATKYLRRTTDRNYLPRHVKEWWW